jgi:hypothetical protein
MRPEPADAQRDALPVEDAGEAAHRVGGDAGGLEPDRAGAEQRAQVVLRAAELEGHVVEQLVEHRRARRAAA